MGTYRMDISYDGTCYGGWQVQPNAVTIQELIQNALKVVLRIDVALHGSGRTDAGVHALQQTAHFVVPFVIDPYRLTGSLNGVLPKDIRILKISEVSDDFHSRYSAIGKEYHYALSIGPVVSPFKRLYCWQIKQKVDLLVLQQAATQFLGTHDFTSFANEAHSGSAANDAVRTLTRADVVCQEDLVVLQFEGNGFLYKMVRNMVGTLIECAIGKRPLKQIPEILLKKDRRFSGPAAPPQGLFLVRVDY